jgi:hypothetical protein
MKIWVYTVCFNESHFVGNFLIAYQGAERIIAYDNYSTDNTVELLRRDPRVEVRYYDTQGEIRDDVWLSMKNNFWKEARGQADWVVVVDFDEIFTRVVKTGNDVTFDLDLSVPYNAGFNIIKPYGYNMISWDAPLFTNNHPWEHSQKGTYHPPEDKMCCFRPDHIQEINYVIGAHQANPVAVPGQEVNVYRHPDYKVLHYKAWNYALYMERANIYRERMSELNKKNQWAFQYLYSQAEHEHMYMAGMNLARPILDIEV